MKHFSKTAALALSALAMAGAEKHREMEFKLVNPYSDLPQIKANPYHKQNTLSRKNWLKRKKKLTQQRKSRKLNRP